MAYILFCQISIESRIDTPYKRPLWVIFQEKI